MPSRITYWAVTSIVAVFTVGILISSHLSGLIPAVPSIFAVPPIVQAATLRWRVRKDLRSVNVSDL